MSGWDWALLSVAAIAYAMLGGVTHEALRRWVKPETQDDRGMVVIGALVWPATGVGMALIGAALGGRGTVAWLLRPRSALPRAVARDRSER